MRISGCIITKDEENNITRCINSLKPVVSEIIVVDTGSSDNTVDIAKKLGAKVYHFEWVNDFSKAKNYAISKATGNWIIFLDADEYLEENSAFHVDKCINQAIKYQADGIYISLVNYDTQRNQIQSSVSKTQIFKNDRNIRYFGAIHERLRHAKRNIVIHDCSNIITIIHTGYTKEEVTRKNKSQRNINLLLNEISKDGDNFDVYFYLAESYALKENEMALYYALRASKENSSRIMGAKEKNCLNIIKYLTALKYPEDIIERVCIEAIKLYPNYPDYYIFLASIYLENNKTEDAIILLEKSISLLEGNSVKGETIATSVLLSIYKQLAELYYNENDFSKAVHTLTLILKTDKYEFKYLNSVIKIFLNNGETEKNIIEFLNRLYDISVEKDLLLLTKASINNGSSTIADYYMSLLKKAEIRLKIEETEILFLKGNYERVANDFCLYYSEDRDNKQLLIKAITATILSGNNLILEKANSLLKETTVSLINNILSDNKNEDYSSEELELIVDIIKELKRLGKYGDIEQIVVKTNNIKILLATSELFYYDKEFNLALAYYDAYVQHNKEIEDKQLQVILYKMSNCLYLLGEYTLALGYIEHAYSMDIHEIDYNILSLYLKINKMLKTTENIEEIREKVLELYPNSFYFLSLLQESDKNIKINDNSMQKIIDQILLSKEFLQGIYDKAMIFKRIDRSREADIILEYINDIDDFIPEIKEYDKPAITIITRVYNDINNIKECIESVLNQSFIDFEWVILDNGCTDGTSDILLEYADKDKRIKLFKNEKNSVIYSVPYNPEFKSYMFNCKSEYMCDIDSDDFFHRDFLNELYMAAKENDYDVAVAGTEMFHEDDRNNKGYRIPPNFYTDDISKVGDIFPFVYGCFRPVWGKLIRTSIYIKTKKYIMDIKVKNNIIAGTDTLICIEVLKEAKSIIFLDKVLHYYRIRKQSIYNSLIHPDRYLDDFTIYQNNKTLLKNWDKLTPQNHMFIGQVLFHSMKDLFNIIANSNRATIEEKLILANIIMSDEKIRDAFQEVKLLEEFKDEYIKTIDIIIREINKN